MEDEIKGLKQERSTLTSKVKTAAIGFESCLQRNEQDLEYQFQAVQHAFNDFTSCHLSYEEAIKADDSFETYKNVNGLNLDDYYNVVKRMHDNALGLFVKFQAEKLEKHSILFVKPNQ